jgi:hypothetical protein
MEDFSWNNQGLYATRHDTNPFDRTWRIVIAFKQYSNDSAYITNDTIGTTNNK